MNSRRDFLKRATLAGGAAFSLPLERLWHLDSAPVDVNGYGRLRPVKDEATGLRLLELPEGFRYWSFGWTRDPLSSGVPTPGAHDGMAAFDAGDGRVALIKNHELGPGAAFSTELAYDPSAGGGTTTLVFDPATCSVVSSRASLSGTIRNCAGGATPWGSWLTCEETTMSAGDTSPIGRTRARTIPVTRDHGYVFEVPLAGTPSREPLRDMGRFVHEAVAVDPESGIVYETEDQRRSGLYRFIPNTRGRLADGGRLQMLGIAGRPQFDTRTGQKSGVRYPVRWLDIAQPERAHVDPVKKDGAGVFTQGHDAGGAVFGRLEGAYFHDGHVFVTATNGGNASLGQVWELDIREQELRLVFESPGAHVLNMPDNLVLSPRGGLVLCEDSSNNTCIRALTRDGRIARFARNAAVLKGERHGFRGDFRDREFAGATFSPDGRWLFVNLYTPGMTLAITGPWDEGPL